LGASERRVLRRIFGPKRDEETQRWKSLYNEVLHNLYSPQIYYQNDQIKENEMRDPDITHGRDET
jgi:hypothetical protein